MKQWIKEWEESVEGQQVVVGGKVYQYQSGSLEPVFSSAPPEGHVYVRVINHSPDCPSKRPAIIVGPGGCDCPREDILQDRNVLRARLGRRPDERN